MADNPDAIGIEFIEYKNIVRINDVNFKRAHAFDWILLNLKEYFVIRYTGDWHNFTPLAIKLRTSAEDKWIPVTMRSKDTRLTEGVNLQENLNFNMPAIFDEDSIYRHHLLFTVCVKKRQRALQEETNRRWGGDLGGDWGTRFINYPVEMVTVHTQAEDFHPENPAVLNVNKEWSDPTPIVFPAEQHAHQVNSLNALVQKVRTAINNRVLMGNTFAWNELRTEAILKPKRVEGQRFKIMMEHCTGGLFMPYITMRNGPIDFAFLRKYNNEPQSVAVQAKSFPGSEWDNLNIDVGHVVQTAEVELDVLLLINEFATSVDIYFINWEYFKARLNLAAAAQEGMLLGKELMDEQHIHQTANLDAQTRVSVMTFTKFNDITDDARTAIRNANNLIFRTHLATYFRPVTLHERLIVEAGAYIN